MKTVAAREHYYLLLLIIIILAALTLRNNLSPNALAYGYCSDISIDKNEASLNIDNYKITGGSVLDSDNNSVSVSVDSDSKDIVSTTEFDVERLTTTLELDVFLSGWKEVSYVAIGIVDTNGRFLHTKAEKFTQNDAVSLRFSFFDRSFMVENIGVETNSIQSSVGRVFIKGVPSDEAKYEINNIVIGEKEELEYNVNNCNNQNISIHDRAQEAIEGFKAYYSEKNKEPVKAAEKIHNKTSLILLNGSKSINYESYSSLLDLVNEDISQRYSFHALNHVNTLLLAYMQTDDKKYIESAKWWIDEWLKDNYYTTTKDKKYAWYDHGVAERHMVLVLFNRFSLETGTITKDQSEKYLEVIFEHSRLLLSEFFYVRDQNYRYHNHGMFQDLSLLLTSNLIPEIDAELGIKHVAEERLLDQLRNLLIVENGYAVLIENSTGYHAAVEDIIKLSTQLINNYEIREELYDYLEGVKNFTNTIAYVQTEENTWLPALGDTFKRTVNSTEAATRARNQQKEDSVIILEESGYAIVNGFDQREQNEYQLTISATSKSHTHKHNDDLSFTLFFDGVEWITDPSFYSHQYSEPFPAFLRSENAHNVVIIENQEYRNILNNSNIYGQFANGKYIINAEHNKYEDITIKRILSGTVGALNFYIKDSILGQENKTHKKTALLHLGEGVNASIDNEEIILQTEYSGERIIINFKDCDKVNVVKGLSNPYLGWTGIGFRTMEPINTIKCQFIKNSLEWGIRTL